MLTLKAPAKINWSLYILDRRADGYHNIATLMQCISLYDTIHIEPHKELVLESAFNIPVTHNLVYKAAKALRDTTGCARGARIRLTKEIPTGAGLGGGSSDAATTLEGLNKLWELGLTKTELKEIGADLGSDVPFFFDYPSAIALGRGELLTPVKLSAGLNMLIVKPEASIPTAWAYGAVAAARNAAVDSQRDLTNEGEKLNNIKLIISKLNSRELSAVGSAIRNDFESVAEGLHPVINSIRARLTEGGARAAMLSGSGSAIFGLFETADEAKAASVLVSDHWNRTVVTL